MVTRFLILMTYGLTYRLTAKIFVRCTTRHPKENSLKISAQSIQPIRRSYPDKVFLILMTYRLTYGLMVKIFVRCTTRHLKENSLKISA